jgi:phage replication-related protein YjqB (UPF0714/DUF867 family)
MPRTTAECLRQKFSVILNGIGSQPEAALKIPDAKLYTGYADLSAAQRRGVDFEIQIRRRQHSPIAIIAPHGGHIEDGTSEVAQSIAGDDFNLYLFEGIRSWHNYTALHLTSHRFDEPECLSLIAECQHVVAIHGCEGDEPSVLLGGLDLELKDRIAAALHERQVVAHVSGHRFPAIHPQNIVNRGARDRGVQLEIAHPLRRSTEVSQVVAAVRSILLPLQAAHVPYARRQTLKHRAHARRQRSLK